MKKNLLLLAPLLFSFFLGKATHNQGGEITVKQTGTLEYLATIHTYTKASSFPADRDSLQICWGDGMCEWVVRDTSFIVAEDLKYNSYPASHTYSAQGTFIISMTDPNRNGGIINIPLSDNVPFHIETMIVVNDLQNSTPIITNNIADFAYVGEVYQHNPMAFDCDGDSLVYELMVPLKGINEPIPNYSLPNEFPISIDNIFIINSEFGTITWTIPQDAGLYTVAIKISEFRGDNLLSTTIRDFQITVEEDENFSPEITTNLMSDQMTLSVGDTLNIVLEGVDPDAEDLWFRAGGQPFSLNNPPSFSAPADFQTGPISANFNWVITDDHVLFSPHYLVFRLEEQGANNIGGLTKYEVVKISVNDSPTSTDDLSNDLNFTVFPNPISDGILNIKFEEDFLNQKTSVEILSLDGKVLLQKSLNIFDRNQTIDVSSIISGNYIVKITSANQGNATMIYIK